MFKNVFMLLLLFALSFQLSATTWFPAEHKCPHCGYKNELMEIGSYGSYIYQWPSKFQNIFWPLTESPAIYACTNCYYSCYMWDFDSIPEDRFDRVDSFLQSLGKVKRVKDYQKIPVSHRLEIAEQLYQIYGEDDAFWARFYRVMGYHYEVESKFKQARQSRLKALAYSRKLLNNPNHKGEEKVHYYSIACMFYFTKNTDSAEYYLNSAKSTKYESPDLSKERNSNIDEYYNDVIMQYFEMIARKNEEE